MSNDGMMVMSKAASKTRLAIAAFDGGEMLLLALAELLQRGFAREQLGVVALSSALTKISRPAQPNRPEDVEAAAVLDDVEQIQTSMGHEVVVVTRGSVWQRIGSLGHDAADDLITAQWMTQQLRDDLNNFIRSGVVVLGASAFTLEQQRQSTRVLLEHSSHRVQTHEFML